MAKTISQLRAENRELKEKAETLQKQCDNLLKVTMEQITVINKLDMRAIELTREAQRARENAEERVRLVIESRDKAHERMLQVQLMLRMLSRVVLEHTPTIDKPHDLITRMIDTIDEMFYGKER